jgi:hypothetical protein
VVGEEIPAKTDHDGQPAPDSRPHGFPWRNALRLVLGVYLVTLPACTQNAGHFGPGFFPLIAALLLVPLFAVIALTDALYGWIEAAGALGDSRAKWVAPVLMSLIAAGYFGIIVVVLLEKMGR